jgi:hypothetical protein
MITRSLRLLAAFSLVGLPFLLSAEKILKISELSPEQTWEGTTFRISDADSRVSLASVQLSVSDLTPENGNLVGEYTITVPLMKSKNDRGRIILPIDLTMQELGREGGVLRGKAISSLDENEVNVIVCEIFANEEQELLLDITTSKRTIRFESNYSIIDHGNGS